MKILFTLRLITLLKYNRLHFVGVKNKEKIKMHGNAHRRNRFVMGWLMIESEK
jgi:hypothetical protein